MTTNIDREIEEQEAFLIRLLAWEPIARSPNAQVLLRYLFDRRYARSGVTGTVLCFEAFKQAEGKEAALATLCTAVRGHLRAYAKTKQGRAERWCADLPKSTRATGYRLRLSLNPKGPRSSTEAFWWAHLTSKRDVTVIYNAPPFFMDRQKHKLVRYTDVNSGDETKARGDLKAKHSREPQKGIAVEYLFFYRGEVEAHDALMRCFGGVGHMDVGTRVSQEMKLAELGPISPVIFGNARTNELIERLLKRREADHLCYLLEVPQVDSTGQLTIKNATSDELDRLPERSIVKRGKKVVAKDNQVEGYTFGLITRVPNPFSESCLTMINTDYSQAMYSLAKVLVIDEWCEELLGRLSKDGSSLPTSFEALYLIDLGNNRAEPGRPKLIGCRGYDPDKKSGRLVERTPASSRPRRLLPSGPR